MSRTPRSGSARTASIPAMSPMKQDAPPPAPAAGSRSIPASMSMCRQGRATSIPRPAMCAPRPRPPFGAGADGIVWAREYHEMWLANLAAGGETTRQILRQKRDLERLAPELVAWVTPAAPLRPPGVSPGLGSFSKCCTASGSKAIVSSVSKFTKLGRPSIRRHGARA